MAAVADGERHACPPRCPNTEYALLLRCWDSIAKDRPSFAEIAEHFECRTAIDSSAMSADETSSQPGNGAPAAAFDALAPSLYGAGMKMPSRIFVAPGTDVPSAKGCPVVPPPLTTSVSCSGVAAVDAAQTWPHDKMGSDKAGQLVARKSDGLKEHIPGAALVERKESLVPRKDSYDIKLYMPVFEDTAPSMYMPMGKKASNPPRLPGLRDLSNKAQPVIDPVGQLNVGRVSALFMTRPIHFRLFFMSTSEMRIALRMCGFACW